MSEENTHVEFLSEAILPQCAVLISADFVTFCLVGLDLPVVDDSMLIVNLIYLVDLMCYHSRI